jgi:hypothetical protein
VPEKVCRIIRSIRCSLIRGITQIPLKSVHTFLFNRYGVPSIENEGTRYGLPEARMVRPQTDLSESFLLEG